MKKILSRRIFCVLVAAFFVLPMNVVMIDDAKGDTEYLNVWREAESWDRSYDTNSGDPWLINTYETASDGKYTKQVNKFVDGDYAEWDFTVYETGTYHFWVRGWIDNNGCSDIALLWNGSPIGYGDWYKFIGGEYWEWTDFGSMSLSLGSGTLRIESQSSGLIEADNIVIIDNPNYTPSGKGVEGSTSHEIGQNNQPEIEYLTHTIDDSSGDNDGIADAGETIDLMVTLQNTGPVDATGVEATLSIIDPKITITDSYAFYGAIPGDNGTAQGDYVFTVEINHASSDPEFTLTINDDQGNQWTDTFSIHIHGFPLPQYYSHSIDDDNNDDSSGNNDGEANPGETIELKVTLLNAGGDVLIGSPKANLSTSDPLVTITDNQETYGLTIAAGFTRTCSDDYDFFIDPSHAAGSVEFTLDIFNVYGQHWTDTFTINIYETPAIEYYSHAIDDDSNGDSSGNDDGEVNPGESIELKVTLINTGSIPANGVSAYLSTVDSLIIVTDNYEEYPSVIIQDDTGTCLEDFDFDVDPSHEAGDVEFMLDIYDTDNRHWTDTFTIPIHETQPEIGLDNLTMKTITQELSEIIKFEEFMDFDIYKGRAFGTPGELRARDLIEYWFSEYTTNLDADIHREPIGDETSNEFDGILKYVNDKMEVHDYTLKLKGDSGQEIIIPNNESFPYPCWINGDEEIIDTQGYIQIEKLEDVSPFWSSKIEGTSNEDEYTIPYASLGNLDAILFNNLIYTDDYSNVSFNETSGKIHLINPSDEEYNETVDLAVDYNASGFILMRDNISEIIDYDIAIPGVAVSEEDGSFLRNLIQTGTVSVTTSDEGYTSDAGNLNIYHTEHDNNFPTPTKGEVVILINSSKLEDSWLPFQTFNNLLANLLVWNDGYSGCAGFLFYDNTHSTSHFCYPTTRIVYVNIPVFKMTPSIYQPSFSYLKHPCFSINGSIYVNGQPTDVETWVENNNEVYADFSLYQVKNPAVESYNVYCDVEGEDTNRWIVFSGGHHDGWWGQMSIDNAVGPAIMLGILKYYNDNQMKPKCNIRFISHGGEEYGLRGSLSHYYKNQDFLENVEYIINLDQLAHNFPDSLLRINCSDNTIRQGIQDIVDRTDYDILFPEDNGADVGEELITSTDARPYYDWHPGSGLSIHHINFCNNNFPAYHLSGNNHLDGDVMDVLDSFDLNVTAEIILNVTKHVTNIHPSGPTPVPMLSYSPTSYDFGDMQVGETASTTFEIWNDGSGTLGYSLSESCGWVDVSPVSGSSNGETDVINIDIDTAGLSVGSYSCDIQISSNGGDGVFTVSVDVIDSNNPVLEYAPSFYDFGDMQEEEADTTTFEIWNSGSGTLTYSLSESCSWVTASPMNGDSTGEHDTITVDIDTTGLSTGSHQCDISINSNGGSGVFTVYVNIVENPTPVLSYNPTSHDFDDMQEGQTGSTTFDIWNSGSGALSYSISESCSWVTVSPMNGDSTGEHDMITIDVDTTGLSVGSYSCDIQISSNGGDGVFTVNVNIIDGETEQMDQEQTIYNTDFTLVDKYCAQSFIPTISPLTKIELYIGKTGNPSSGIMVSIRSLLTGANLASVSKTASEISSSMSWVEFDTPDLDVTTGNTYYIVVEAYGTLPDYYKVGYSGSGNSYTDGTMYQYNFDFIPSDPLKDGSGEVGVPEEPITPKWLPMLNCDLCFKTYGQLTNPVPILSYTPTQHDFGTLTQGDSASTSFEIWNSGTGTLSYSLSESCGWVTVSPLNGDSTGEHDTIIVDINTSTLSEGSHSCDISIDGGAGGSGIFTVSVNIILPAPVLSYTPTSHDFGDMLTDQTDTTSFEIWNSGTGTLTYSLSESYTWIEISPISGTSTGEHDIITVDIDTTGLTEGTYTSDTSIMSDGGNGVFTVTVNIVTSAPVLSYTPTQYDFGTMTQGDSASTSFEIWNSGTGTLEYNLSENYNWMTVTPTSGSSTDEHDTINVNIDTSSLTEGTYTGDITINSNGGAGIFTVTVQVILVSEQIDQEQTIYNTDFSLVNKYCAQSFIPTISPLTKIELYIGKTENPSSGITVSIRSLLTGANLASVSKTASEISSSMSWVEFDTPDLDVTPGNTYYIVVEAYGTLPDYYKVGYSGSGNSYTDGTMYQYNFDFIPSDPLKDGSGEVGVPEEPVTPKWQTMLNCDLCFKTYGIG